MKNVVRIHAGKARSYVVTEEGAVWGWGSIRQLRPSDFMAPEQAAALCESADPSRVGHSRFARAAPIQLTTVASSRVADVVDARADVLMLTKSRQVETCRPRVFPDGSAGMRLMHLREVCGLAVSDCAAYAVRQDGDVWSWGLNASGQLGRPAAGLQAPPGSVPDLPAITSIAAGAGHVLALDEEGRVWSWGANAAGQLGQGKLQPQAKPARVRIPAPITQVSAGATHSMAIDQSGRLWAWGSNHHGQLGISDGSYRTQPAMLELPFAAREVGAGMHFSVATDRSGAVYAWGWNGLAQLGRDDMTASAKPTRVPGLADVDQLSVGTAHVLALCAGQVFAWGDNRQATCGLAPDVRAVSAPRRVELA